MRRESAGGGGQAERGGAAGDGPGAIALPIPVRPAAAGEIWGLDKSGYRTVRNVVVPTLTPVLPTPGTVAAGAAVPAVIVAPGGAFRALSIDSEGYQVARWLADHGIAAFVLKYRLVPTPADPAAAQRETIAWIVSQQPKGEAAFAVTPEALADAKSAVRVVRARAAAWNVDPHKVGFVGFSAGAITTLALGTDPDPAARPDFIAPIYGPMHAITVPTQAPPMFVAVGSDDALFGQDGFGLIDAWRKAHRPVELHYYERGQHGFGMTHASAASSLWIEEFQAWMRDRGFLAGAP